MKYLTIIYILPAALLLAVALFVVAIGSMIYQVYRLICQMSDKTYLWMIGLIWACAVIWCMLVWINRDKYTPIIDHSEITQQTLVH